MPPGTGFQVPPAALDDPAFHLVSMAVDLLTREQRGRLWRLLQVKGHRWMLLDLWWMRKRMHV